MRIAALVIALWLCPVLAYAQTGVPTSYTLKVYVQGATTPTTTLSVPVAQVTCNQVPVTATNVENPAQWRFDDRAIAGRQCAYADATRFLALPDGAYEGTIAAVNADGSLGETARIPFTRRRPNPPAVPTGLQITP